MNRPLTYTVAIPLLRQKVILRQLGLALGLPILLLAILLLATTPLDGAALQGIGTALLIVIGILVVLLGVVLLVVYGGRYEYTYTLDDDGIAGQPSGKTSRVNRITNLLGAASGNATTAGAALLAAGRQKEGVAWAEIDRAEGDEQERTICLYGGKIRRMVVFGGAHYHEALAFIQKQLQPRADTA